MFQRMFEDLIGKDVEESEREERARKLTETVGYAAAGLTLVPLPGTELLGVTSLHVAMVVGIGQIHDDGQGVGCRVMWRAVQSRA